MNAVQDLVAAARERVETLTPAEVAVELDADAALLVDVREPTETVSGVIPGAVLAPRGMLEFHADPTTTYHLDGFSPERRVIVYCASGARSALAAQSLSDLGYQDVAHLGGGIKAWAAEDRPTGPPPG